MSRFEPEGQRVSRYKFLATNMRVLRVILVGLMLGLAPAFAWAAEAPEAAAPAHEEHGLPQQALRLGGGGGSFITNSMVVTWIVAAGLILFAQIATRNMKLVPEGAQNFWEWMVE